MEDVGDKGGQNRHKPPNVVANTFCLKYRSPTSFCHDTSLKIHFAVEGDIREFQIKGLDLSTGIMIEIS